jgi:hypothetical protein
MRFGQFKLAWQMKADRKRAGQRAGSKFSQQKVCQRLMGRFQPEEGLENHFAYNKKHFPWD